MAKGFLHKYGSLVEMLTSGSLFVTGLKVLGYDLESGWKWEILLYLPAFWLIHQVLMSLLMVSETYFTASGRLKYDELEGLVNDVLAEKEDRLRRQTQPEYD